MFQNVSKLRTADIKPYIIFVAAPNMERLKSNMRENCGIEPNVSLSVHVSEKFRYCYDMVIRCNCQLINQRQHPESLIFRACAKIENRQFIIFVPY